MANMQANPSVTSQATTVEDLDYQLRVHLDENEITLPPQDWHKEGRFQFFGRYVA